MKLLINLLVIVACLVLGKYIPKDVAEKLFDGFMMCFMVCGCIWLIWFNRKMSR